MALATVNIDKIIKVMSAYIA